MGGSSGGGLPSGPVFEFTTIATCTSFTLPIDATGTYDFYVDWGDSSGVQHITAFDDPNATHSYSSAASYTIKMVGTFTAWNFNNVDTSADQLKSIVTWGSIDFITTDPSSMFYNCVNLESILDTNPPTLTGVTSLLGLFEECAKLSTITAIASWDVSSVEDFSYLFVNCALFNGDVSGWDVSSATLMNNTFSNCSAFNRDISGWDVSSVTDMTGMLENCVLFNHPIGLWTTTSLEKIEVMLDGCTAFDQDLSNWDISHVTISTNFLRGGKLSRANYDALLASWGPQIISSGSNFNVGTSRYSSTSVADRNVVLGNWPITDGGIWLDGYDYRKTITISRASGAVYDYQLKLLVGESSGATGENVDCGGHCLSTFNDLRFIDDAGTELDYWIETITGSTPNQLATVWIEFNTINTDATTFHMFYGKSDASSVSNGANTFIFFDDFERGANGDAVGGGWTVDAGTPKISTAQAYGGTRSCLLGNAGDMKKASTASSNVIVSYRVWKDTAQIVNFAQGDATHLGLVSFNLAEALQYYDGAGYQNSSLGLAVDTWHLVEVQHTFGTSMTIWLNGVKTTNAGAVHWNAGSYPNVLRFSANTVAQACYVDNILVRQYLSTEPAWGSWGSEAAE